MSRISPLRLAALLCLASGAAARAETFSLFGYLAAAGGRVQSQPSWLARGFGRLQTGAERSGSTADRATLEGRLGLRYELGAAFAVQVEGVARREPDSIGDELGLSQAFLEWTQGFAVASELRVRAGLFFLPTTREAIDPLWTSPYTLTLSALNSWIGDEVRPEGVDLGLRLGEHAALGATVFRGNDTAGALLAWRGWSLGSRVSTLGEVLPLPPLSSLADPRAFGRQRDSGTQPVGRELDGRNGWSARGRLEGAGALVQGSAYDNRGDRELHDGEYAWRTRTQQLAGQIGRGDLTLVAEGLRGSSAMGSLTRPHVDIEFWAWYALASAARGPWRTSLRYDRFYVDDRDHSAAENNDERGSAWTAAAFWQPGERFRLGLEYLALGSRRPAAAESGGDANTNARQWTLEARIRFD